MELGALHDGWLVPTNEFLVAPMLAGGDVVTVGFVTAGRLVTDKGRVALTVRADSGTGRAGSGCTVFLLRVLDATGASGLDLVGSRSSVARSALKGTIEILGAGVSGRSSLLMGSFASVMARLI